MSLAEWLRSQEKARDSPLKAATTSPAKLDKPSPAAAKQTPAAAGSKPPTPALFAPSTSSASHRSPSLSSPAADVIDISADDSPTKRGRPPNTDNGSGRQSNYSSSAAPDRSNRVSTVKDEHLLDDKMDESEQNDRQADDDEEGTVEGATSKRSGRRRESSNKVKVVADVDTEEQPLSPRTNRALPARKLSSSSTTIPPRNRKRQAPSAASHSTAVSSDVSVVLRHVHSAMNRMHQSESKPAATLASLGLSGVKREVALMEEDEVRCQIEKVFLLITDSILASEGFSFDVPVRSGTNQLYVPELNRIVLRDRVNSREFASYKHSRKAAITARVLGLVYELCQKRIHTTKRDLFYTDVKLFSKQEESDDVLDDAAAMIGCTRTSLNVVASEKGVVVGQISFFDSGDFIDW